MFNLRIPATTLLGLVIASAAFVNHTHAALVGHWQLNESSGTTAPDVSGNGNIGVLSGFPASPWVAGQINNGLSFDGVGGGTNDIVTVGSGATATFDHLSALMCNC